MQRVEKASSPLRIAAAWVFVLIGVFQAMAIATAVGVGGGTRALRLQKA